MSQQPHTSPLTSDQIRSGIAASTNTSIVGYASVPGMSSRFAAAVCCGLLRIQTQLGVAGPIVEIGPFEGRFFIAMAHALAPGETALGIDLFDWPNPEVARPLRGQLRQARCSGRTAHHLEGRQSCAWSRPNCWPSSADGGRASSTSTASIPARR